MQNNTVPPPPREIEKLTTLFTITRLLYIEIPNTGTALKIERTI